MKRKTTALLLSLFFVSSVVAISTINNGEQVTLVDDYQQNDQAEELTVLDEPTLAAEISENHVDYVTDSAVVLVETKEDKQRLKVQEKQIKRGKQKQLTANLNKQAKQALEQQIAEEGQPLKAEKSDEVVIAKAADNELSINPSKPPTLASLSIEQKISQQRKALNLGAPIPPGTFGGGNGNGGPGAGVSAQTASGN